MAAYTPKTGLEILKWNRAAANAVNQGARNSVAAGIAFTNPLPEGSIANMFTTSQSIPLKISNSIDDLWGYLKSLSMEMKVLIGFGVVAFLVILKD